MTQTQENPYRLSDEVLPRAYRIFMAPDLVAETFKGSVEIDLAITTPQEAIVLNAIDLELDSATLTYPDGSSESCAITLAPETERAFFSTGTTIERSSATLRIEFHAPLSEKLVGFYLSRFVDPEGKTRTIATTQFESTDARRAFPCFDEPAKKATFAVTLQVAQELAAYSNYPVVNEEFPGDGTRIVTFAPSMVMSSYLVAFIVGPFEETAPIDSNGTPIRVIYPPGKEHLTHFALDVADFALRYFSDYFDIPYPGEKLDLVAVPDFAMGAMENLGCVTFRETALLVDPETASTIECQRVIAVIAHELAHMWFGDLVTMGWWEGIWLNEAFATFMEVKCGDAFRPEAQRWVTFLAEREAALALDGLHRTRPIEYEVISPDDAGGMFDLLTYEKGGGVLRMLEQFMGEVTFRDGIRHYLQVHAYANTVTEDLWDALESVSTHPIRTIMNTWILQGGHPVLTVENGLVSQTAFAYGTSDHESKIGDTWLVPLQTRPLDGGQLTTDVLGRDPQAIAASTIVNAGGWGFYRTSYGSSELAEIAHHLDQLDAGERAVLFADTWAATLAGHRRLSDFFTLAAGLSTELEPTLWSVVAGALTTTARIIDDADRPQLATLTRNLFGPLHEQLGWDGQPGETEQAGEMRGLVLGQLGTNGDDAGVRAEARRRFDAKNVTGDTASAVISIIAHEARVEDFDEMVARYKGAIDPQEESRYLQGMQSFESAGLCERTFMMNLTSEIRGQDFPYVIAVLLTNPTGGAHIFSLLVKHWDECLKASPSDLHGRMLSGIARMIPAPALAKTIDRQITENPVAGGQLTALQAIERMWVGVDFAERERGALSDTLRSVLN